MTASLEQNDVSPMAGHRSVGHLADSLACADDAETGASIGHLLGHQSVQSGDSLEAFRAVVDGPAAGRCRRRSRRWVVFAAVMMIMVGSFQVIMGLTALFKSGYYAVPAHNLLVSVNYTGWGLTHIVLGALAVAAAFGLFAGQMWARVVGVAMALVSSVVNLAFMSAYPWWSIAVITLDVVVIYAIVMHGAEMKARRR